MRARNDSGDHRPVVKSWWRASSPARGCKVFIGCSFVQFVRCFEHTEAEGARPEAKVPFPADGQPVPDGLVRRRCACRRGPKDLAKGGGTTLRTSRAGGARHSAPCRRGRRRVLAGSGRPGDVPPVSRRMADRRDGVTAPLKGPARPQTAAAVCSRQSTAAARTTAGMGNHCERSRHDAVPLRHHLRPREHGERAQAPTSRPATRLCMRLSRR